MNEEDRATAIRHQKRTVERRRDEVIREARAMVKTRATTDTVQALHDLDEATRRLTELEAPPAQLGLPALLSTAPVHPDDPSPTPLPFEASEP